MPIYEYACDSCGHRFEKLVRVGAEPPPCPQCGSAVRKLVSQSGFILRGGGWYKDHYGLKSSGSESGASKSDGGGGESKPASTDGGTGPKTDGGGGGGSSPPKSSSGSAAAK
jgi:putative FmdB family regulatory protein